MGGKIGLHLALIHIGRSVLELKYLNTCQCCIKHVFSIVQILFSNEINEIEKDEKVISGNITVLQ